MKVLSKTYSLEVSGCDIESELGMFFMPET